MSALSRILTTKFLSEYVGWLAAPIPFVSPLLAVMAFSPKWLQDVFRQPFDSKGSVAKLTRALLLKNLATWLSTYLVAWAVFKWADRNRKDLKYSDRTPSPDLIKSEAKQSLSGVFVCTALQVAIGTLRRSEKPAAVAGKVTLAAAAGGTLFLALWPDFHFYWSHRALHSKALYSKVHKLHHRSKHVDPWSGLSMHTLEHVAYFSALLPCVLPALPLRMCDAMGTALIIYPAPAHIGIWPFEKHHWQHHAEFNYNYGSSQLWDELMGTTFDAFRQRKVKTKADKERAKEAKRQMQETISDL